MAAITGGSTVSSANPTVHPSIQPNTVDIKPIDVHKMHSESILNTGTELSGAQQRISQQQ